MEHRWCPEEYQARLDNLGTNPYGESIFRLAWGPTETFKAGGAWVRDGFVGYRDIPLGGSDPCWMILMWEPAEVYGSPGMYYHLNRDEATGLCDLGEYPHHGRYRLINKLLYREMVDGELKTFHMELNSMMLDSLIPMVKLWQGLSHEKQRALAKEEQEREEQEKLDALTECRKSYAPAFGLGSRVVQKKAEEMEKVWGRLMKTHTHVQRGFNQTH